MRSRFNNNRKKFILLPFGIAAILALISYVVMLLWNNLLPDILHVTTINFWQAMGIFVLSKILFGFGKGGGKPAWMQRKMEHRFEGMSPEDKERLKQRMKDRFCNWNNKKQGNP